MFPEENPDTSWVARLANATLPRANQFVKEASRNVSLFRHITREHTLEGRSFYIEIEAPLELYAISRALRPRHVVEVGVSSGVSTAYLLSALDRSDYGTLHSVDRPLYESRKRRGSKLRGASWSLPPGREPGWVVPTALKKRWDLRIGDKAEVLPQLAEELDHVELFLYDVPHTEQGASHDFSAIDLRFQPGSIALADHGGTQELCPSLRRWATRRSAVATGRSGLGLYGFRCG